MPTDYETKIAAIAAASKEFLTVVVGVALAYAIATRGPEIPGLRTGTMTIWCSQVGALAVYIFYASRFYINNWLYLSESYDEKLLSSMNFDKTSNKSKARKCLARAYFDLILSIYTAVVISFVAILGLSASGNLTADQWHNIAWWLMLFLMAHYLIDSIVLLGTIVISHNKPLNKMRSGCWVANNFVFFMLFVIHFGDVKYGWLLKMLFYNCMIAVVITAVSPLLVQAVSRYERGREIQRS